MRGKVLILTQLFSLLRERNIFKDKGRLVKGSSFVWKRAVFDQITLSGLRNCVPVNTQPNSAEVPGVLACTEG